MPRFQAIFSDIDGTLLNPQHQLSPRNRAAGRAVVAAGIPIVLVSARPPAAMRPLAEALGPGLPLIALNGALILDGADRIIQQRALSPAALATLTTLLAESPALLRHDYCGRHWYCADPTHPRCRRETAIIGLEPEPRPAAPRPRPCAGSGPGGVGIRPGCWPWATATMTCRCSRPPARSASLGKPARGRRKKALPGGSAY